MADASVFVLLEAAPAPRAHLHGNVADRPPAGAAEAGDERRGSDTAYVFASCIAFSDLARSVSVASSSTSRCRCRRARCAGQPGVQVSSRPDVVDAALRRRVEHDLAAERSPRPAERVGAVGRRRVRRLDAAAVVAPRLAAPSTHESTKTLQPLSASPRPWATPTSAGSAGSAARSGRTRGTCTCRTTAMASSPAVVPVLPRNTSRLARLGRNARM